MKNDCINKHCIYREEDGSCEADINYCKEYIPPSFNEILTKHSEAFMKGLAHGLKTSQYYMKLDETRMKLERVSGYSFGELLDKFAAGWTLEPPKKPTKLSELIEEMKYEN